MKKKTPYLGSKAHMDNYLAAARKGILAQQKAKKDRIKAYKKDPVRCANCGGSIEYGKHTTNKFCSRRCAGLYNTARRDCSHSDETKAKIQAAILQNAIDQGKRINNHGKGLRTKTCKQCQNKFEGSRRASCCSQACAKALGLSNTNIEQLRKKGRESVERQMANGNWKGWSGRGEPSYPERYVMGLMEKANVSGFHREHQVLRFSIDFAFPGPKLALEVDGKQHEYAHQKAHDIKRDDLLEREGWLVVRLKWASIKTDAGRQSIHGQFEKFLRLLNALESKPASTSTSSAFG